MVTPKKGVYDSLPLNAAARKVADTWDPAKDEAAGESCRAYGAANVMRIPGRLHITWEDPNTLRIDTDAGTQTRLLRFSAPAAAGEPTWQGQSVAEWEVAPGRGARTGNLKVVTTNLRPGYVRKNGAPYSAKAVVTEYLRSQHHAERRSVDDGDDQGRGPRVLHAALPHHDRLQEAARRGGMEPVALLGSLNQLRNQASRLAQL